MQMTFSAFIVTVNATTGDVATAAVVIDIVAMAAVATVIAADTDDSTGTYAVFSMAIPLVLTQLW